MKARWKLFAVAACTLCCLPLIPALLGATATIAALKALPLDTITCAAIALGAGIFAIREMHNPAKAACDCTETCTNDCNQKA